MDIEYVGIALYLLETPDPYGDPLELMIQGEEIDERDHKPRGTTYHEETQLFASTH